VTKAGASVLCETFFHLPSIQVTHVPRRWFSQRNSALA